MTHGSRAECSRRVSSAAKHVLIRSVYLTEMKHCWAFTSPHLLFSTWMLFAPEPHGETAQSLLRVNGFKKIINFHRSLVFESLVSTGFTDPSHMVLFFRHEKREKLWFLNLGEHPEFLTFDISKGHENSPANSGPLLVSFRNGFYMKRVQQPRTPETFRGIASFKWNTLRLVSGMSPNGFCP